VILVQTGDITAMVQGRPQVVLVNAANPVLLGGGGVDGAIHRAAGPELRAYCRTLTQYLPGIRCFPGQVVATPSFGLKCGPILHTVGPDCRDPEENDLRAAILHDCYLNSFLAGSMMGKEMYFPAISTGIYGYPITEATQVAAQTLLDCLKRYRIDMKIVLVAFDATQASVMSEILRDADPSQRFTARQVLHA
jgi:O-acetyl-ADP-ribose deacetylase (regulator of RNase III)